MNIKEFYLSINASYDDILHRLCSDDIIKKFILMFLDDQTFDSLTVAFSQKNLKAAYIAAHTLKGIALNLCFSELAHATSYLVELLRNNEDDLALLNPAYQKISNLYNQLITNIKLID